jgi:hypothetical protein
METITIKGNAVCAVSPEGQEAKISLGDLMRKLTAARMDTGGVILPDGVISVLSQGNLTIWVHQTPPRVFSFKWIAPNSQAQYGPGTKYQTVKLALPYLVVFAVFAADDKGLPTLSGGNECFFRNDPLSSLDDELLYPALLNCSKFTPQEGRPLAWICTQHLNPAKFAAEKDAGKRMRTAFKTLMHCLLETGFNYSSEHHEGSSWFTESTKVDPRVATVEKWQAASEAAPMFALEVPWLKTGHTVRQLAERIFKNMNARPSAVASSADLARLVFNHKPAK